MLGSPCCPCFFSSSASSSHRESFQWCDHLNRKVLPITCIYSHSHSNFPQSKLLLGRESLRINGLYNPCCHVEELTGRESLEGCTKMEVDNDPESSSPTERKRVRRIQNKEVENDPESSPVTETKRVRSIQNNSLVEVMEEGSSDNSDHQKRQQTSQQQRSLVALLKVCAQQKDLARGSKLHADIIRMGLLENNTFLGNSLVTMYTKCGALAKAQEVFNDLPVRNIVTWNALITGYTEHGCTEQALSCFKQMQLEGITPDAVTFLCILKIYGSIGASEKGKQLHSEIDRMGFLEKDFVLGTALVDMYIKCGLLTKAQEVFDKLPVRDVVSWNALIAGYVQHGNDDQALKCFELMQHEGLSPDAVTYFCALRACGNIRALHKGRQIHAEIAKKERLQKNISVGYALIDMYAKCGLLTQAQEVFNKLEVWDAVSWGVLIAGYVQQGQFEQALKCFECMQKDGLSPNTSTSICALKACGNLRAAIRGKKVHAEIIKEGLLEKDMFLGTALVDMYAKCGLLTKAQVVFNKLPVRDVVSWCALIAGYTQHGHGEEALNCFECMQAEGLSPDAVTYVCILKACGRIGATNKGLEIHAKIAEEGLLENDVVLGTSLVDMYAKCGLLTRAQEVFDELPVRNLVSWSALISGYAQHGHGEIALKYFKQMRVEGLSPNAVTFACALKACGSIGAVDIGQEIHAEIVREGFFEKDPIVCTAVVDMYSKCGCLDKAQEIFDRVAIRNIFVWNALISGYAQHGDGEKALEYFERMKLEKLTPDAITFTSILKACGSIGATDKGQEIHTVIAREGLLEKDFVLGGALVGMYAKCGLLEKAQEVFDTLPVRDVVSWSALITGYALLGKAENVFHLFDQMVGEGIKPDLVTFSTVLNACNHAGCIEKGQMYFESMNKSYGINPTFEHTTCMVDLFARAGHLDKAAGLIKKMPYSGNLTIWNTLLAACQKWGNIELGRLAFEHAVQLDESDAGAYVCMSNIYANAGRQVEADKIEAMRVDKKAWKKLGHRM